MNKVINKQGEALLNNNSAILLFHDSDVTFVDEGMCQFDSKPYICLKI